MINHARTLILNASGDRRLALGVDGEEYVPPTYVSMNLTGYMAMLHSMLMGSNPDAGFENAMLAQYMQALHSVDDAEEYILGLDPRVTYLRSDGYLVPAGSIEIVRLTGTSRLLTTGSAAADAVRGTTLYFVRITRSLGKVTAFNMATGEQRSVDGNSIEFSGVRFHATGDGMWDVKMRAAPNRTIADVIATLDSRRSEYAELWRGTQVRFNTWWMRGQTSIIRISGLLCAFVERMNGMRNGG